MTDTEIPHLHRQVRSLAVATGFNTLAYSIIYPFLPIYLHTIRGFPMSRVGLVFPAMGLATIVGGPLSGMLADKIGRRALLLAGPVGRSVCFFILALLTALDGPLYSFVIMLFMSALVGMFFLNSLNAYVTDLVGPRERAQAFGTCRIGLNVGWMIGPAIGAFLARTPFALLFGLGLAVFLSASQFVSTLSIFSTATVGISRTQLGFLYTINGAIVIVLQSPMDRLFSRFSLHMRSATGALGYVAAFAVFGLSASWSHLVAGIGILTIGEILVMTSLVTAVSREAPSLMVGRYMGIYGMVHGLGWALGPYAGSLLYERLAAEPLMLWVILASGAAAGSVGFFWLFLKEQVERSR
jgi:MFS family permease